MNWTVTEIDIVRTLACKIKVLTPRLAASGWWPDESRADDFAERSLRRLHCGRLLELYQVNVHPSLAPAGPVLGWSPGDSSPDFQLTALRLQQRWNRPAVPTHVYAASPLAANLFAGSARGLPSLLHRDHDLLLAEAFVHYLVHDPQGAQDWVGEQLLPKAGYRIKDPDAFLARGGSVYRIVESGGSYDQRQLEAFHQYAHQRSLPYEVW